MIDLGWEMVEHFEGNLTVVNTMLIMRAVGCLIVLVFFDSVILEIHSTSIFTPKCIQIFSIFIIFTAKTRNNKKWLKGQEK